MGLVSLGCAKNLVDSEVMLGALREAGYQIAAQPEGADVLIVNTCGFIDAAKQESIDAILRAARARGRRGRLVVAGCLSQRFAKDLPDLIPEVDAFIGLDQVAGIAPVVGRVLGRAAGEGPETFVTAKPTFVPDWDAPRLRLTPRHFAYVKIAEGCNHPCTFCAIPRIRGRHRSRAVESIANEARQLVASGARELLLISQDTTYFGMDRWRGGAGPRAGVDPGRPGGLIDLIGALDAIEGDFWVRLMYTHPAHWSDALIGAVAASRKVARYVDMPLQHIDDDMLRAMRRETGEAHVRDLVRRIRAGIPGVALRTTFIAGFPGETERQFGRLLEFIEEARFERLGVFEYSREEGTKADAMEGHVPARTRRGRRERAMELQRRIAGELHAGRVGSVLKVLVDAPGVARTEHDAPEIDGVVRVPGHLPAGQFARVRVTGSEAYDLVGEAA